MALGLKGYSFSTKTYVDNAVLDFVNNNSINDRDTSQQERSNCTRENGLRQGGGQSGKLSLSAWPASQVIISNFPYLPHFSLNLLNTY